MIQKYLDRFVSEDVQTGLREKLSKEHPGSYKNLFQWTLSLLQEEEYSDPDPERIVVVDDGHYQGTFVFVIAAGGYQPSDYWYTMVRYGSCSGCDTLQGISSGGDYDALPNEEQIKDYMTLALHMIESLRKMYGESDG